MFCLWHNLTLFYVKFNDEITFYAFISDKKKHQTFLEWKIVCVYMQLVLFSELSTHNNAHKPVAKLLGYFDSLILKLDLDPRF